MILLGFYYWTINQFVVQRTLGAKNLREGQLGALFAGFLKMPNLFLMILPGLIALKLYPDLETPDLAFPTLAFDLMPIGIRGLIMAALIAAIMSSLDSALNSASTLVVKDFVQPLKPDLKEETLVSLGRIVTGIAMVVGAIYAPLIAGFESLFSYFQSSLSYVVPPIVVVYILGLFVPWLNGNGAFWTIIFGLVAGIPIFIVKEVFDLWSQWGLPEIHYTVMSSIIMFIAIGLHLRHFRLMTRRTRRKNIEELVWSAQATEEIFTKWEQPIWLDRTLLSGLLIVSMTAFIIWFAAAWTSLPEFLQASTSVDRGRAGIFRRPSLLAPLGRGLRPSLLHCDALSLSCCTGCKRRIGAGAELLRRARRPLRLASVLLGS